MSTQSGQGDGRPDPGLLLRFMKAIKYAVFMSSGSLGTAAKKTFKSALRHARDQRWIIGISMISSRPNRL
jgi:hypothetical protein